MASRLPVQSRSKAAVYVLLAVGFASMQDAVVKGVSGDLPAYETVIFRTSFAMPLLLGWLVWNNSLGNMFRTHVMLLVGRSLVLCSAYFAFVLSIAALPIATSVSIYFTMPFFVAALSGWSLGEKVPLYRWIAIITGFAGVLIMVRPGSEAFSIAALLALYSAFGYAAGQMMGRHLSSRVGTEVIANWQNITYLGVGIIVGLAAPLFAGLQIEDRSMAFLLRPWTWPDSQQLALLLVMGLLSVFGSVSFIQAYRHAAANFVAPFEYSGLLWAVLNGIVFFGDFPDAYTCIGAAIVITAGFWMLRHDYAATQSEIRSTA